MTDEIKKLMEPEFEAVNDGAMLRKLQPSLYDRATVKRLIDEAQAQLQELREIIRIMDDKGVK